MIETECFHELNVFERDGVLVDNLRSDTIPPVDNGRHHRTGLLSRLFKRKVGICFVESILIWAQNGTSLNSCSLSRGLR